MRSNELFRTVFERHSVKAIADRLNLATSRVYQWDRSAERNPLEYIAGLLEVTKDDQVAGWLCGHANGYFVKNTAPGNLSREHLMKGTDKVIHQFSEMLTLVFGSIVDGQITQSEAEALRAKWQKIQSITEAYIRECEKGTFGPQRSTAKKVLPEVPKI